MNSAPGSAPHPNFLRAAAICLTIWILWVGQDLWIPATIAALISFVIAPIVRRMRGFGVPNAIASTIVTVLLGLVALGLVALTSAQLLDLTRKLPEYRENLVQRIRTIKSSTDSSLTDLHKTVASLQHELETPATTPSAPVAVTPVQVQVVQGGSDWVSTVSDYVSPALKPLTQCSVILLLVFFITLGLDEITLKCRRLARRLDLYQATEAVDEASETLAKYLRAQLLINIAYGTAVGLTMYFFGLPNSLMWGILASMLRYMPYIGPTIALVMPTLLAIAISPGLAKPVFFFSMLMGIELVVNVILEPLFYGHSTGVSSLGVIVSALFWGWLWGAPGLLLAMPITACLVVIGRHVRPLLTIAELLGTEEADAPPAPSTPEPIRLVPSQAEVTTS